MRTELGHLALVEVGKPVVEGARDRELEHRVAEELEPLVRLGPVGSPARMREDSLRAARRERRDQVGKRLGASSGTRLIGAT